MNFFISGGAGFIGGHLVDLLLKENHNVTVMDNLSTGAMKNVAAHKQNPNFKIIVDDIMDSRVLETLIYEADCVFHLAAAVGVELVVNDPVRTITTNVHGTEKILEAASKTSTRIIIASTSEVYGKSDKEVFSETDDLLIGPSTRSRWSYASSKLLDEFFAMAFYRDRHLPATVVRLFNTVGPRQTGQYGMVVPRFVEAAMNNREIPVYGNGEQTRCFCHVYDTVRALYGLAMNKSVSGEVFNIGNTDNISINNLAVRIIRQLKSNSEIVKIPYELAYEKGFEDMMRRQPDIKKINSLLGWKAENNLSDIIRDVADSFKK